MRIYFYSVDIKNFNVLQHIVNDQDLKRSLIEKEMNEYPDNYIDGEEIDRLTIDYIDIEKDFLGQGEDAIVLALRAHTTKSGEFNCRHLILKTKQSILYSTLLFELTNYLDKKEEKEDAGYHIPEEHSSIWAVSYGDDDFVEYYFASEKDAKLYCEERNKMLASFQDQEYRYEKIDVFKMSKEAYK